MDKKKINWGTPQHYGKLMLKYKLTGEIHIIELGIKRLGYSNELVFCDTWGYDEGYPTDRNNPDNWEVVAIVKIENEKEDILSQRKE